MSRLLLRLPPWLARDGFHWDRLAASARAGVPLVHLRSAFGLSGPERRFVLDLLRRHPNLWLFRCNQRAFCGDFALIDMSPPRPAARRPRFVELKARAALREGRGGVQLARVPSARAALQHRGLIGPAPPVLWTGSPEAVLAALGDS